MMKQKKKGPGTHINNPAIAITINRVNPNLYFVSTASLPPFPARYATTSSCPAAAASSNGVSPSLFLLLITATPSRSTRNCVMLSRPQLAARWREVLPGTPGVGRVLENSDDDGEDDGEVVDVNCAAEAEGEF